MPPDPMSLPDPPSAIARMRASITFTSAIRVALGSRCGVGGVEPVDVGQQDHALRARRLRDACGKTIVVAEADLLGGDRNHFR